MKSYTSTLSTLLESRLKWGAAKNSITI
jgi:hypothetical protein